MEKNKLQSITNAIDKLEPSLTAVSDVNGKWETVEGLVDSGEISNPKLISAVQDGLATEQGGALRALIDLSADVPYEELARLDLELYERAEQLRELIASLKTATTEEIDRLNAERDLLLSISPNLESVLDPIVSEEIDRVRNEELANAELELELTEMEQEELSELFEQAGQAWPRPRLADGRHLPEEGEIVTIETFPNEHANVTQQAAESVKHKFESRLTDASSYIALLMQEVPGHVWTAEELGFAVYDDNEDPERNASRIQSLISDYRRGKNDKIGEIFEEKGLLLQRGKRTCYEATTGKRIPNTQKVVWRAVDKVTADAAQIITTITADRKSKWTTAEWENVRQLRLRLDSVPSGQNDGQPIVKVDAPVEIIRKAATEAEPDTAETETVDWRDTLRTEVHAVIEIFKEKNLLVPNVTWKQLRRHLDSPIVATETSRERAFSHKIIKRSEMSEDSSIDVRQAVLVHVQNSFQHILGVTKNRRQAIEIVDEIVSGYFRSHEA